MNLVICEKPSVAINDVEIRSEYEAMQPEHTLIQAMIDAG